VIANDGATLLPVTVDPDVPTAAAFPVALDPDVTAALALPAAIRPFPATASAIPATFDPDEAGTRLNHDSARRRRLLLDLDDGDRLDASTRVDDAATCRRREYGDEHKARELLHMSSSAIGGSKR
jgi:hypothetical protein